MDQEGTAEQWPEPIAWYNRYTAGVTVYPRPEEMGIKNMLFLVAYDICAPTRLRKVAKICEEYGVRVEKSVFECDLSAENFDRFWHELAEVIDDEEDALVAYRICKSCVQQVESLGVVPRPTRRLLYCL